MTRTLLARRQRNPQVGSEFEAFLAENGQLEAATTVAIRRVLAWLRAEIQKGLDSGPAAGPLNIEDVIRRGRARLGAQKRRRSG